jgi:hypothetical protein
MGLVQMHVKAHARYSCIILVHCLGGIYSIYITNLEKTQASVDYSTGDIQHIRSRCPVPLSIGFKEHFKTPIIYPGYDCIFCFLFQGDLTLPGIRITSDWG